MNKISWVNKKEIDLNIINEKIKGCIETKHFTNNGINVIELQKKIKDIFKIDDSKEVLLTCNGAMGLNALVGGLNIYFNKKLKFAVQAFTFPCSKQGLLMDSIVIDFDDNMNMDINELEKKKNEYDGIVITNCFGCSSNIILYEQFCKDNNKILLFDNAPSSYTIYNGKNHLNYGNGCMVSLHHTKPIGFGEGGFIVFDKEYLQSMEKTICFGFTSTDRKTYDCNASNYKMSELNAIYIDNYLNNLNKIYEHHTKLIKYFISKCNVKLFNNYSKYDESLMSCIPILGNYDINEFIKNNIEAKQYYYPLDLNCKNSLNIYNEIICLPLHLDMTENDIDKYIKIINSQKIIIVMATFHRTSGKTPNYLIRSLNSIFNQTYKKWDLIIVSDKYEPEDELLNIITKYKNIIYLKNDKVEREHIKDKKILWNCAGACSMNIGLNYARENGYKYYCHLDDDDYWTNNHLEIISNIYKNFPKCIFCNTKSTFRKSFLPKEDLKISKNNRLPTPCGNIHSSISFRIDIILNNYFTSFNENEIKEPSDALMLKYINGFLTNNKEYCSIYDSTLTCYHDVEGELIK